MEEHEYQVIQSSLRKKLRNNPYAGRSWKTERAYEEGVEAAMSTLHSYHNTRKHKPKEGQNERNSFQREAEG